MIHSFFSLVWIALFGTVTLFFSLSSQAVQKQQLEFEARAEAEQFLEEKKQAKSYKTILAAEYIKKRKHSKNKNKIFLYDHILTKKWKLKQKEIIMKKWESQQAKLQYKKNIFFSKKKYKIKKKSGNDFFYEFLFHNDLNARAKDLKKKSKRY